MSEGSAASGDSAGQQSAQGAPQAAQQATQQAPGQQASGGQQASMTSVPSQADGASITGEHNQPTEAENKVTQTAQEKKRLKDHMKTFFPDDDLDNEDNFNEKGIKFIDELTGYRDKNREYNKKILDVFDAEPGVVDIIKDMSQGATFMEALAKNFDTENLKPLEGDPDYDRWNKALAERDNKRKEQDKRAKEFDDNTNLTSKELRSFVEEVGMDETKFTDYANKVDAILSDAYKGKIGKDFFHLMYKGLNFDKAVATAQAQGEIKGKNEKIKAVMQKEETTGDGLPNLREGGELEQEENRELTAAEKLFRDVDKFNAKRKPLEAYLK